MVALPLACGGVDVFVFFVDFVIFKIYNRNATVRTMKPYSCGSRKEPMGIVIPIGRSCWLELG